MKYILYIVSFTLIFTACDLGKVLEKQNDLQLKITKEFGGIWSVAPSNGMIIASSTNSKRMLNNPDSMDYYKIIIGRMVAETFTNNESKLVVTSIDLKKIFEKGNGTRLNEISLKEIVRYKDFSLEENLKIHMSLAIAENLANGYTNKYDSYYKDIIDFESPYRDLADLSYHYAYSQYDSASILLDKFLNTDHKDPFVNYNLATILYKYAKINIASDLLNSTLTAYAGQNVLTYDIGKLFYENHKFQESINAFTQLIEKEPENLKAYHARAWAYFSDSDKESGCKDIDQMLAIKPTARIPDSTLLVCKSLLN